ncbi:exo-alpha-sialidase [Mesomycoplasma molare]|uniref:exo-alpha-sialidase n=1 Tax=Mesomycoplasma molare TaxID=171288 RepID=A0ABY5TV51_9BACT|nr:sialidase family protein [Mesomycoplasma molare]UWD34527.1 exo-alpha-sialidase [Mesomycoplasma molare]
MKNIKNKLNKKTSLSIIKISSLLLSTSYLISCNQQVVENTENVDFKNEIKFNNPQIIDKKENKVSILFYVDSTKEFKNNNWHLLIEDNNKNKFTSYKHELVEKEKKLIFYFENLNFNREYIVRSIFDQVNSKDLSSKNIIFSIEPSNTKIDLERVSISFLNTNEVGFKIGVLSDDNFKIGEKNKVKLTFSYFDDEYNEKFISINSDLKFQNNKYFLQDTLTNLVPSKKYTLRSANFLDKPLYTKFNINNSLSNEINLGNNENLNINFVSPAKTELGLNSKLDYDIREALITNLDSEKNKKIDFTLSNIALNKIKIDFNNINDQVKIKFSKSTDNSKEFSYANIKKYDEINKRLFFDVQGSKLGEEYLLEEILIHEKEEANNIDETIKFDISNLNKKLSIESLLSFNIEIDLDKSFIKNIDKYEKYSFITLKIKNELINTDINDLINELFLNNFSEEEKGAIKNKLLKIIENNLLKILNKNNINIEEKILILKFDNNAEDVFYEEDNNKNYFIINKNQIQNDNSDENSEEIVISNFDNTYSLKVVKNPFISNNEIGKILKHDGFEIKRLSSETLFAHNEDNSHSYRIPTILKLKNGDILSTIDRRVDNESDYNNEITQVFKISKDNGRTWSENKEIVKMSIPKKNGKGIVIDGVMTEIDYFDEKSNSSKTKLHYIFDVFPGTNTGIPHLLDGNPWIYVNDVAYLKLWTKLNNGNNFDTRVSVLKKVNNENNWFRRYILPEGVNFNSSNFNENTVLEETKTYVDLNYDPATKSISGSVYENVDLEDFSNIENLKNKKTNHSILDEPRDAFYAIAKNSHVATLESYDNGETWGNLQWIDMSLSKERKNHKFVGTGVGNSIQLKHQKNPENNGKILIPMYSVSNKHFLYYIFSTDFGKTWRKFEPTGFKENLSESSFIETEDGEIYWLARNSISWGREDHKMYISKSTDGGLTWTSPDNTTNKGKEIILGKNYDGNVFSGLSYFNYKNKKYFIFSLPKNNIRRNGALFITDDTFSNFTELFKYDKNEREHFVYSYALVTKVTEDYIDFVSVYEASEKFKIINNGFDRNRPNGEEIQIDRFRLWITNKESQA